MTRETPIRLYRIDPIQDPRWAKLVANHPSASVFHSVGWLQALQRTYGYSPVAFTTSSPTGELKNGLVFCRVKSWLTGRRLVSLPFSDHCEPLCDAVEDLNFLIRYLQTDVEHEDWKYLEIRPSHVSFDGAGEGISFVPTATHSLHVLDLHPDIGELFRGLDRDSVQRRIQRARRAGLVEKRGRSEDLLTEFYALFVNTRARHRLPPIPYSWFQNLAHCMGDALEVRLAYKDEIPVASILTLRFRETVYYKYGCSDAQLNKFGAMPWLLWSAIEGAKSSGAVAFDLGRTEGGNPGLLAFKNHWVPKPTQLTYWKFPDTASSISQDGWKLRMAKRVFSFMPYRLLTITGNIIYRHIG
jgi:lipid II:glycine glycyltransferase (peptidoglycan interpeptide bridge formation enzyme)